MDQKRHSTIGLSQAQELSAVGHLQAVAHLDQHTSLSPEASEKHHGNKIQGAALKYRLLDTFFSKDGQIVSSETRSGKGNTGVQSPASLKEHEGQSKTANEKQKTPSASETIMTPAEKII
jgi:hypothetical protein